MIIRPRHLWPPALKAPRLCQGEVHLWSAALDAPADQAAQFGHCLSDDERQRARSLRFDRDRSRFIAARALLREILASYLAVPPDTLRFAYGPGGKPQLAAHPAGAGLQFNLSHCGALALYAVSRCEAVGVDLEQIRPLPEMTLITTRYFRPAESALLHRLDPGRRLETFFQLWTQKEALAKARGLGLAEALESAAGSPGGHPPDVPWVTIRLHPALGFTAALALAIPRPRLHCRQWITGFSTGIARRLVSCA